MLYALKKHPQSEFWHDTSGLNHLDDVMGKRTRAIESKLKDVETLSQTETQAVFPELAD